MRSPKLLVIVLTFSIGLLSSQESTAFINFGKKKQNRTQQNYEAEKNGKVRNQFSIREINTQKLSFGTYHTEGFIKRVYTCPDCPEGSLCKPCQGNHIVISENNENFDSETLNEDEMIIFVDDAGKFKKGKKYRFLIKILDVKSLDQAVNNVKLIYHESVK